MPLYNISIPDKFTADKNVAIIDKIELKLLNPLPYSIMLPIIIIPDSYEKKYYTSIYAWMYVCMYTRLYMWLLFH